MKQNFGTMSRREERQAIMKLRTQKLLRTSKKEYSMELYPHEVKWLRKNYPQVTVSSLKSVGRGELRMCIIKKKDL